MARININTGRCKGCMLCVSACPNALIVRSKKLNKMGIHCVEFASFPKRGKAGSGKECTGCAMCAIMCPDVCIEVLK
ncbi:MAG: ferredoxin family protein [Candidatus Omnitrophota bacterium]